MAGVGVLAPSSDAIYKYLNFDQIPEFKAVADSVGT
jgi:aconitate hydratase 2/2-methylisocitrate dehydratase